MASGPVIGLVSRRRFALLATCLLVLWAKARPGGAPVYAERPYLLSYGTLHAATFAPDGATLATAGSAGAVLWDLATGEARKFLELPPDQSPRTEGHAAALVFSPDQSALYALYGFYECGPAFWRVVRWALPSGEAAAWSDATEAVAAFPELAELLRGAPCQWTWNWYGGDEEVVPPRPGGDRPGETPERRSPDDILLEAGFERGDVQDARWAGERIVALARGDLLVLDEHGAVLRRVPGAAQGEHPRLDIVLGGAWLLLDDDAGVSFYEVATGHETLAVAGRQRVAIAAGGRRVALAGENGVEILQLPDGRHTGLLAPAEPAGETRAAYRFSPSARHLSRDTGTRLTIWDTETGRIVARQDFLPGDWLWSLRYDKTESRVAVLIAPASLHGLYRHDALVSAYRVVALDLETGERLAALDGHTAYPEDLSLYPG